MSAKRISLIILVVLFLVFLFSNTRVIEIRFLIWTFPLSTALVLLGSLLIGLAVGWILKGIYVRKSRVRSDRPVTPE
jgi:lipopolysaccharide assembly protein A